MNIAINIHKGKHEIDREQWNDLARRQSDSSSFFQSPACFDFYEHLSFLDPFVFGVSENMQLKGVLCGYIIANGRQLKRFFSRRAIVLGGVLVDKTILNNTLELLLKTVIDEIKQKVIYIEIRNFNDYSIYKKPFEKAGFIYNQHLNYRINLSDKQQVFSNFSESKRRQIKQAEKWGVYWEVAKNNNDLADFYTILNNLYHKKINKPLFPFEFFQKLNNLHGGRVLVVKKDNKVIGGMACVLDSESLYEWFVCGDDTVDKKYYSSVMATWAGIEYAIQNNVSNFDFMGAGKPSDEYGVREFKKKFGGELLEQGRFIFVCQSFLYQLGLRFIKITTKK